MGFSRSWQGFFWCSCYFLSFFLFAFLSLMYFLISDHYPFKNGSFNCFVICLQARFKDSFLSCFVSVFFSSSPSFLFVPILFLLDFLISAEFTHGLASQNGIEIWLKQMLTQGNRIYGTQLWDVTQMNKNRVMQLY